MAKIILISGYFKTMFIVFFAMSFFIPAFSQEYPYTTSTEKGTIYIGILPEFTESDSDVVKINIDFINPTTKKIQEHIDYRMSLIKENESVFGPIPLTHTSSGSVSIPVEIPEEGKYTLQLEVEGILFQPIPQESASMELELDKSTIESMASTGVKEDGKNSNMQGCLIATASYGSEMAPQVQMLREIRDNTLLSTASGHVFMNNFNSIYYSFSPSVAQWEQDSPMFKEAVKLFITPMITTLSIMTLANEGSEIQVVLYGLSTIGLIVGMYVVMPITVVWKIREHKKNTMNSPIQN